MATVKFSVPEEIKEAFQEAFANEDRSAVIARLMQQAVEEKRQRRAAAIEALLDFRRKQRPVSDAEITRARKADLEGCGRRRCHREMGLASLGGGRRRSRKGQGENRA